MRIREKYNKICFRNWNGRQGRDDLFFSYSCRKIAYGEIDRLFHLRISSPTKYENKKSIKNDSILPSLREMKAYTRKINASFIKTEIERGRR